MHPFINQDKVLAASKKHGMAVVAYCPIARGKVPGADALERIGKAHGKSAAQVSLRYLVQMGVCPIPRTATPDHLKQNIEVFDFKLRMPRWRSSRSSTPPICASSIRRTRRNGIRREAERRRVHCPLPSGRYRRPWRRKTSRIRATPQRSRNASRPRPAGTGLGKIASASYPSRASRTRWRCRRRRSWRATRARSSSGTDILNESFRRLRAKLEDKQVRKMREMQRAWIASRDKSCELHL